MRRYEYSHSECPRAILRSSSNWWSLNSASVISADGKTVYGWGFNPDGFIEMFKVVLN